MSSCCSGLAESFFLFLGFCDAAPTLLRLEVEAGVFCFSSCTTANGEATVEDAGLERNRPGIAGEMDIFLQDPFADSPEGTVGCIDESNIKFCGGASQGAARGPVL
jgi:hypothetical protein